MNGIEIMSNLNFPVFDEQYLAQLNLAFNEEMASC